MAGNSNDDYSEVDSPIREPSGKALIELAEIAAANGRADLSRTLVGALERELGICVFLSNFSKEERASAESILGEIRFLGDFECHQANAVLVSRLYELLLHAIADMPEGERRNHIAKELHELARQFSSSAA